MKLRPGIYFLKTFHETSGLKVYLHLKAGVNNFDKYAYKYRKIYFSATLTVYNILDLIIGGCWLACYMVNLERDPEASF